MLSETAKDIAGYEGKYSVTTDGRVYSHSRVDACGRLQKGRWLKPVNHSDGQTQGYHWTVQGCHFEYHWPTDF